MSEFASAVIPATPVMMLLRRYYNFGKVAWYYLNQLRTHSLKL
jgi:hypothetical protein